MSTPSLGYPTVACCNREFLFIKTKKGVFQTKPKKPVWPILLLLLGATVTVGAFYYLTMGSPQQMSLLQYQAIAVGAGTVVALIIAVIASGDAHVGKRPVWPLLLPVVCGIFIMGIYYALMIGAAQVMQVLVLQGYSVGIGTLLILLLSVLFWRNMRRPALAGIPDEHEYFKEEMHEQLRKEYEESGHPTTVPLAQQIRPESAAIVERENDLVMDDGALRTIQDIEEKQKGDATLTQGKLLEGELTLNQQETVQDGGRPQCEQQEQLPQDWESSAYETQVQNDVDGYGLPEITYGAGKPEEQELPKDPDVIGEFREDTTEESVIPGECYGNAAREMLQVTFARESKSFAENGVKKIGKLDALKAIQDQLDALKEEFEASNNEVANAVISGVNEVEALVTECKSHHQDAQCALNKATENMRIVDDKMAEIEEKIMTIREAVSEKIEYY